MVDLLSMNVGLGRVCPALAGTAGVLAGTAVELLLAARRTEIVAPALVLGNGDGRVLVHLHVADGIRVYGHGDLLSAANAAAGSSHHMCRLGLLSIALTGVPAPT
jgi:hypothetical protein